MDIFLEAAIGVLGTASTCYEYIATGYKAVRDYISGDLQERREADEAFRHAQDTIEGKLD